MKRLVHPCYPALTVFVFLVGLPALSHAHPEDYLEEKLVFMTIEEGKFELEYWFDCGHRSGASRDFMRHHIAVEHGITKYWMIEGRGTIEEDEHEDVDYDSGLVETRYRFGVEEEHNQDGLPATA